MFRFQNLIGMLGSVQAVMRVAAFFEVSKPYRYARK